LDRFLLSCRVSLPAFEDECRILERFAIEQPAFVSGVATLDDVRRWRAQARCIDVDERIKRYAVQLVTATRVPSAADAPYVEFGVSPRATLGLVFAARAKAFLAERSYVLPDDVRAVAPLIFRHRIGFTHRVAMDRVDPETIVEALIAGVAAP
jgi:MoxR-like ATPase